MTDPNPIARLREALDWFAPYPQYDEHGPKRDRAIEALAQLETEREADRGRIAELEQRELDRMKVTSAISGTLDLATRRALSLEEDERQARDRIRELESQLSALRAPETAPVDGELDDAVHLVASFADDFADCIERDAVDKVCAAARKWAALRWRPASEAQNGLLLVTIADEERKPGEPFIFEVDEMTDTDREHGWMAEKCGWVLDLSLLPEPPDHLPDDGSTDIELPPDSAAPPEPPTEESDDADA